MGLTANKFAGYGRKYLYNPGRASLSWRRPSRARSLIWTVAKLKQKKAKQKVEVAIDDCEVNTRCPHCQSTTYRIPLRAFIGGSAEAL